MTEARALVLGPGARRALRDGARGIVETAFAAGGYVRVGRRAVLIAPARSPVGPLSVLVAGLGPRPFAPGDRARVDRGALAVGRSRIVLDGAREVPAPRAVALAGGWRSGLAAALAVAPAVPVVLAGGLAHLASGDVETAVTELAGRGEGLTPAGDDVLAGFAAWRWADGVPLTLPGDRCTPLGRDYLRCAERGELPGPAARLLDAIRAGDAGSATRRARRLAIWGTSSGPALLWGMAAAAGVEPRLALPG